MRKFLVYSAAVLLACCCVVFGWWLFFVPSPYSAVTSWAVSPALFDRSGNLLHVRLSVQEEYCIPVPLHAMGNWLPLLAVAVEDKRFYSHPGVDVLALSRATVQNIARGKTVSGASTITSQLVRIAVPRSRTVSTKLIEFAQALHVERNVSKSTILELYLNRAPMGGTLRGVEAAARGYFGKPASKLSLAEAAMLVGMFKGPTYYRPDLSPKRSLARRNEVLQYLGTLGVVDGEELRLALLEPMPVLRANLPTNAWHFAELVFADIYAKKQAAQFAGRANAEDSASYADGQIGNSTGNATTRGGQKDAPVASNATHATSANATLPAMPITASAAHRLGHNDTTAQQMPAAPQALTEPVTPKKQTEVNATSALHWMNTDLPVATTLQRSKQELLERVLQHGIGSFPQYVTAAGAIVDTNTGELVAYVGDIRFSLAKGDNWVNCGVALRSPGSTLKPFLYAEAFEQGILLPNSLLADTPLSFSGKAPRNYDRSYRGPVSAKKALALSLNAPAVRVLRLLGQEEALQTLHAFGMEYLQKAASFYGDSLALGGCEVTLLELARAYTALAHKGHLRPLLLSSPQDGSTYPPVYKQASTILPLQPVSEAAAYLTSRSLADADVFPAPYKEIIAHNNYTIAAKTGTSYGLRDAWAAAYTPQHTVIIWVGSPSGKPHESLVGGQAALPLALETVLAMSPWYGGWGKPHSIEQFAACAFSGKPATPFCPQTIQAERIKNVSHTMPCTIHKQHLGKAVTVLPPDLAEFSRYFATSVHNTGNVEIVSPRKNGKYMINPLAPVQKIGLKAEGTTGRVYWFINQEFFAAQEEGEQVMWPLQLGKVTISLVDEAERKAVSQFEVLNVSEKKLVPLQLTPVE